LLPPFVASFFIALFVLMMQFLWLWIDDIIGKGIDILVILELLGYLLVHLIPLSIPIAILISSVMVFGNMAENHELSSFKSAGVSLFRMMRSAILFGVFCSAFAYISADYLVPVATLVKKAPATVTVPFMENCEGAAVLLMTEGSAVVAAPNVTALRLPE
jgi:lipopolysaccharide export system permease protein